MTIDLLQSGPRRDRYGRPLVVPKGGGTPKAYTRPTTIAGTLDDRYNLELWKQRQVLLGVVARPDLHALAATTDPTDKKALNRLCSQLSDAAASDKGANTGTAVHAAVEAWAKGETWHPMFDQDVAAVERALRDAGLAVDPDHVEQFVVNDPVGAAGTYDLRLTDAAGVSYIGDLKTGSTVEWSARAFAVQLAIYADADSHYDWSDDTHSDPAPVDRDRGVIVHHPAGTDECEVYWIDLAAGREALEHALWVRRWRNRKGILTPFTSDGGGTTDTPGAVAVVGTVERPTTRRPRRNPHITDAAALDVRSPKGKPDVQRIDPVTPATPRTAPEGERVDADRVGRLLDKVTAQVDTLATMQRWAKEAQRANVAWNVQRSNVDSHSERRMWCTAAALVMATNVLADADDVDDYARAVLAVVIGDDAHQPLFAVGGLIGTLTVDQARQAHSIAAAGPTVIVTDDGVLAVKTA